MPAQGPIDAGAPKVLLLACGGTIASTRTGRDGAVPSLSAEQLTASLRLYDDHVELDARSFSLVPSSHATLDDVLRLHAQIMAAVAVDPAISGVVVTHGTDTLEEVAFALDLLWTGEVPIVVTGAMRNASVLSPDGDANIAAAVATATSAAARGLGVLVVMNDEIHAARFVRKSHPSNVATFTSPTVGPIGFVAEGRPRILLAPRTRSTLAVIPSSTADASVALYTVTISDDGRLLRHVLAEGYRGIVIEGLGGGHVTPEIAGSDAFTALLSSIPVVLSTRSGAGEPLRSTYSFVGSETDLRARGIISSGVLDGRKARVLLTLLIAGGATDAHVRAAFMDHGAQTGE